MACFTSNFLSNYESEIVIKIAKNNASEHMVKPVHSLLVYCHKMSYSCVITKKFKKLVFSYF